VVNANGTTGCPTAPGANPYQVWCREVVANLPGGGTTPWPSIVINRLAGAPNPDDLVTVTVTWQMSTDLASHQYVTTALSREVAAVIFVGAYLVHVGEALYARALARRAGLRASANAWALQTFLLGFPSLRLLRARQRRPAEAAG